MFSQSESMSHRRCFAVVKIFIIFVLLRRRNFLADTRNRFVDAIDLHAKMIPANAAAATPRQVADAPSFFLLAYRSRILQRKILQRRCVSVSTARVQSAQGCVQELRLQGTSRFFANYVLVLFILVRLRIT